MKQRNFLLLLALTAAAAQAAQQSTSPTSPMQRELIYCAGQMSHEEREAYRAKMQGARTAAEKEALRAAHRAEMQSRAAAQGKLEQCAPTGRQWRGGSGR